ncbi:MAG: 4Fe-4S ferredoxin [Bacteroidetes bacterium]|nr:4Fe-4S ferredoxin [Bacteroidota bacterium]
MKRDIVLIDETKCNGCGQCVPNCHEGALQIIDNKARLVSDLFCDGLGACIGHCPEGAISIVRREAEPYDEVKVIEFMVGKGKNTIYAHLQHLKDHGETEYLRQGIEYLKNKKLDIDLAEFEENEVDVKALVAGLFEAKSNSGIPHTDHVGGCPGSKTMSFGENRDEVETALKNAAVEIKTELRQWPVQLHLLNPQASYFRNADVILVADCVAYSVGDFHRKYLKGRSLAIACPKLDSNLESYVNKLMVMIRDAKINTLNVIRMEVPCCGGLVQMAQMAANQSGRKVPVKEIIIGIQGDVLKESWI